MIFRAHRHARFSADLTYSLRNRYCLSRLKGLHEHFSSRITPLQKLTFFVLGIVFITSHSILAQTADIVLFNGKIVTMDQAKPEVSALSVLGNRILAIGSNEYIKKQIGPDTQVIDLEGHFMMPGLIEGHGHFVGLGQSLMMLDLSQAKSWDDIVHQVTDAAAVTPSGQWIVGRGWHQSKWDAPPEGAVEGYPSHDRISQLTPNHPVLLTHASGHANFANEYAMRLAQVDENTSEPAGGEILTNQAGQPIGVFRETAQSLVSRVYQIDERKKSADQRASELRQAIELAFNNCLEHGITSFQDAGSSFEIVDFLRQLAIAEQMRVRLYMMIRESNEGLEAKLANYKIIGLGNDFFTVRALKRSIDGALGPHGAWLLAPYEDLPTSSGLNTATVESVRRTAELALEHDFQMCVHAIGDRANREVLDIYQALFKERPASISRRWRIEHAQHIDPADLPRFAKLEVIASMQGIHCTSDAIYVPQRLGMRRSQQGAYVWRSLIDSGAIVTNGTDAPVEPINPFESIYASVTRRVAPGVTFFPQQSMTRIEALRSYSIDCAYAAFEETQKGSLVPGKLADLVVLSHDLLDCPEDDIRQCQALITMVGGKILFRRPSGENTPN